MTRWAALLSLFAAMAPQKVNILTMASKEAVAKRAHAGKIVAAAQVLGGNGGGRPDMAQSWRQEQWKDCRGHGGNPESY